MTQDTYTQLGLRKFPRHLAQEAKKAAAQCDMTLSDFVALVVRQALKGSRQSLGSVGLELERDLAWYERHRSALTARYPKGTNIAIVGEQVVDRDADATKLVVRLRERYGRRPIVMPRLGPSEPTRHIRSPRRVR